MSAVLVDTNGPGNTAHIGLSGFDITLVTGASTFENDAYTAWLTERKT